MSGRLSQARVLVTRPRERAEALCFLLEDEGAEVVVLPSLELLPPTDPRPLQSAAEQIGRFRWVLFASPSAVDALAEAVRQAGTRGRFAQTKLAAIGPATARALKAQGFHDVLTAADARGPGLFEAVQRELAPGDEVLLPVAEEGRPELHDLLVEQGLSVTRVAAYRSEQRAPSGPAWSELVASPPDLALFGSPRTFMGFASAGAEADGVLRKMKLVAIGPTTARAIEEHGLAVAATASEPTTEAWVEAAVAAFGSSG